MTRALFVAAALALTPAALAANLSDDVPSLQKGKKAKNGKKGKKGGGRDISATAGTKQLNGHATLDVSSAGGQTTIGIDVAPEIGIFIADSFEILGEIKLGYHEGLGWGVATGARYFIDLSPNWLYVGAKIGYGSTATSNGVNSTSVGALTIGPGAGLLVPLGKNVALDVGTTIDIRMASGATTIHVPIGMLGIQAFFD